MLVSVGVRVPVGVRVAVVVLRTPVGVMVDVPPTTSVGVNVGFRVPCGIGVSLGLGDIVAELDCAAKMAKLFLADIDKNITPNKTHNVSNRAKVLIIS